MKYNELKNGDYFKIVREQGSCVYIKHDGYFSDATNPKTAYRKLNGGTLVEKVIK